MGDGNSHVTFLWWLCGRRQVGVRGVAAVQEAFTPQCVSLSVPLCCSVESCQERGKMGKKEVWLIKQTCPLSEKHG